MRIGIPLRVAITEIGQVVTLAYIDAHTKLVTQMGSLPAAAESHLPKPIRSRP